MDLDTTLVNSLLNPEFYPHKTKDISLVETHSSWVILTGDLVYKIKKPVNFGFLDFSTLEKRKNYCYQELKLNSRFSKTIYLKVIPLYGSKENPSLDNAGPIIEYILLAKQFPQDSLLSSLEKNNILNLDHINQIAEKLAHFHLNTEKSPPKNNLGNFSELKKEADDNFLVSIKLLQDSYLVNEVKKIEEWSNKKFTELKTFIDTRLNQGFVRNCHGDLHLENMVLLDNSVTFFDCIEFNEEFRWVDVINDVAFIVMDLMSKHHFKFAFALLNQYLEITGDYPGIKILDLLINYRAMVKAKVTLLEPKYNLEKFNRFLAVAKYVAKLKNKKIILMHGVSGSGKSYISARLSQELQAIRIRSDIERKRVHKSNAQLALYSKEMDVITFSHLLELAKSILDSGFTVIVDATFITQQSRAPFIELSDKIKVPISILSVQASYENIQQRVNKRLIDANDASDADMSIVDMQLKKIERFSDIEQPLVLNVDTNLDFIDWQKLVVDASCSK